MDFILRYFYKINIFLLSKLAAAGFYFIGNKGEDLVRCFMCNKELDGWDPRDDPMYIYLIAYFSLNCMTWVH